MTSTVTVGTKTNLSGKRVSQDLVRNLFMFVDLSPAAT